MSPERDSQTASLRRIPWLMVGIAALTVDIVKHLLLFAMGPARVELDASRYWELGGLIAEGDFLFEGMPIAYRTPGYPLFVGLFRATLADGALFGLIAAQHLLVVLTTALTGWICWRIMRHAAAVAPALAASSVCLTRPWFAGTVLTETVFTFALTLHAACIVCYVQQPRRSTAILMGVTLAVTILIRPVTQLWWLPLSFIVLVAWWNTRRREAFVELGLMLLTAFLLVVPWVIRNQQVLGEPFLTRFVGRELWIATFPPDAGAHLEFPDSPEVRELRDLAARAPGEVNLRHNWEVSRLYAAAGIPDDDIDRRMQWIAVDAIKADPGRFAWYAFKRGVNFWRCVVADFPFYSWDDGDPGKGHRGWHVESASRILLPLLRHVPARHVWFNTLTAAIALSGGLLLVRHRETRLIGLLLLALLLYVNGVTAVFELPNIRYRFVLEPVMIVGAVCGWMSRGRWSRAHSAK